MTADASGPQAPEHQITRAKLESLVDELIEKPLRPCRTAIKDAGISVSDISDVILVGGMTRMPKVQEGREFFGKDPRRDVNPDKPWPWAPRSRAKVLSGRPVRDIAAADVTPLSWASKPWAA